MYHIAKFSPIFCDLSIRGTFCELMMVLACVPRRQFINSLPVLIISPVRCVRNCGASVYTHPSCVQRLAPTPFGIVSVSAFAILITSNYAGWMPRRAFVPNTSEISYISLLARCIYGRTVWPLSTSSIGEFSVYQKSLGKRHLRLGSRTNNAVWDHMPISGFKLLELIINLKYREKIGFLA